jgi:pimeloyl-ACP methyl ester carboxylesterase
MKKTAIILFWSLFLVHCHKEQITIGLRANDTFYIKHEDASMHVLVRGNTASKQFLIIVHGGPGSSGYLYQTPKMEEIVQKECAVVYYDQRNAGASQGNADSDLFTLPIYADDLHELISVLQYRYGDDIGIFLLSKSFGGLVASQFMTQGNNQATVKGWIFANATHNSSLNDSLTYQMLLDEGTRHIAEGKNADAWKPIVSYCEANPPGPFTFEQSYELTALAWEAQGLIEGLEPYKHDIIFKNLIPEQIPLTNFLLGRTNAGKRKFNRSLNPIKFSDSLGQVTVPVLVCFGKLDFVCPVGLGDDFFAHIGSTDKKKLLFEKSAHRFEEQEAYYQAFRTFILEHK